MKQGDRVVCKNGDFHPEISKHFQCLPVKDVIYTIRTVRPTGAEGGILLEELKNKPIYFKLYQGFLEPAFHKNRFSIVEPIKSIEKVETEELAIA